MRAQVKVYEGKLGEAAELLERLSAEGFLEQDRYVRAVRGEIYKLLWKTLTEAAPGQQDDLFEAAMRIWRLVVQLDMRATRPLLETMLVRLLVAGQEPAVCRAVLDELLSVAPDSLPFRQLASTLALEDGDKEAWADHLLAATESFLERKELVVAARLLQGVRSFRDDGRAAELSARILDLGAEIAETSASFRECLAGAVDGDLQDELEAVESFLQDHPWFEPAQEELLRRAEALLLEGRHNDTAMELGQRALLRENFALAREHFRLVIDAEPEYDEAILYLASLDPPTLQGQETPLLLRVRILLREDLPEAARHHALKGLTGGQGDVPLHEALAEAAVACGQDSSAHLLRCGCLALDRRDLATAQEYFLAALSASGSPEETYQAMLDVEDLGEVFSPRRLEELRPA